MRHRLAGLIEHLLGGGLHVLWSAFASIREGKESNAFVAARFVESGVEAPEVTPMRAGRSSGRKFSFGSTAPETVRCSIELSGRMQPAALTW